MILYILEMIYDPYNNFDGNGEKFMNQFIEFNASYLYPLKDQNTYFTDFDVFKSWFRYEYFYLSERGFIY